MQLQTRISALRKCHRRPPQVVQRIGECSLTCGSNNFPTSSSPRTFRFPSTPAGFSQNEKRDVDHKALFGA